VIPHLREAVATTGGSPKAGLDEQIAAKRAEVAAPGQHWREVERGQAELDALLDDAKRYEELAELAAVIEALNVKRPGAEDAKTLCRFYVRRPWGKQYPFMKDETSNLRPFHATQLALIRDTLTRWGIDALPGLQGFLKEDRTRLAAGLEHLAQEQKYWEQQRARLRGGPLARIAREREDLPKIRAELQDIALLIECAAADKLGTKQLGGLCEIFTRRGWPKQNELILDLLERSGDAAASIIRKHIQREQQALPELEVIINHGMTKPSSTATKEGYDRAMALKRNILQGIDELERMLPDTE